MVIEEVRLYLEIVTYIVTIIGVPVAIYIYIQEKIKERNEREYGTYNALDDKYIDFLKLCLDNKEIDFYDINDKNKKRETEILQNKEIVMFEILFSIFERAYLMYQNHGNKIIKRQWNGWAEYIDDWMKREKTKCAWKYLGKQWDSSFINYINNRKFE